jgi:hypothetical protein
LLGLIQYPDQDEQTKGAEHDKREGQHGIGLEKIAGRARAGRKRRAR